MKSLAFSLVILPAVSFLPTARGGFVSVIYLVGAVSVVIAVLLFLLLTISGITPRVEWGRVKRIWFERLPK